MGNNNSSSGNKSENKTNSSNKQSGSYSSENLVKTGVSSGLDFVPVVSNVKGAVEAISGKDYITGEKLSFGERVLSGISAIPGGNYIKAVKNVNKASNFVKNVNKTSNFAKKTNTIIKNEEKIMKNIPTKLLKDNKVDVSKFGTKLKNRQEFRAPNGYTIQKDTAGHGGSAFKLKDDKGKRVASIRKDGEIVGK